MLRSMYSGISGMKNFQTKLDVIGNNIANVNTYGFKKGRVVFKDMISQSVAGAAAPTEGGRGGTNSKQVGLGGSLAAIDTIHTEGSAQTTNRTLDMRITGDGYFVVNDGTTTSFTRAGNFYLDQAGNLVNSDGLFLRGIPGDGADPEQLPTTIDGAEIGNIKVPTNAESLSIGPDGIVTYVRAGEINRAGQIAIAKFSNPEGLEKVGENLYQVTTNSGTFTDATTITQQFEDPTAPDQAYITIPQTLGSGSVISGQLEMSNVDLSEEFTDMIVAQRGFQANTRIITTSDEILQELVNLKR
ncbi:flagellar basal body rod protein FlgG [Bacillus sp. M6-12]|uniref:flagellar hook-basal body complex protein n=1 Tax=Bacillus sp. M6-12 TaxID=2054166 RepID=UPI000C78913F|nr:flagellar hook-basal body complex protein [Bacillus sp. M6-12]PLS16682.1 flagellar basal body rod protein FlgG [Bacillus sp. M6-12]